MNCAKLANLTRLETDVLGQIKGHKTTSVFMKSFEILTHPVVLLNMNYMYTICIYSHII